MQNIIVNRSLPLRFIAWWFCLSSLSALFAKDAKFEGAIVLKSAPFFTIQKIMEFHDAGVVGEWKVGELKFSDGQAGSKLQDLKAIDRGMPLLIHQNDSIRIDYLTPLKGDQWTINHEIYNDGDGFILNPLNRRVGKSPGLRNGDQFPVVFVEDNGVVDNKTMLILPENMDINEQNVKEILKASNGFGNLTTDLNSCLSKRIEIAIPGWIGISHEELIGADLLSALWNKMDPKMRPFVIGQCVSYESRIKKDVLCQFLSGIAQTADSSETELLLMPLIANYFSGWPSNVGSFTEEMNLKREERIVECAKIVCLNSKHDNEVLKYARQKFCSHN